MGAEYSQLKELEKDVAEISKTVDMINNQTLNIDRTLTQVENAQKAMLEASKVMKGKLDDQVQFMGECNDQLNKVSKVTQDVLELMEKLDKIPSVTAVKETLDEVIDNPEKALNSLEDTMNSFTNGGGLGGMSEKFGF